MNQLWPGQGDYDFNDLVTDYHLTSGSYTLAQLDIGNFNPFLIVGLTRGHEVHLPDYTPTTLVDPSWFGQAQDNSIPLQGKYYKTEGNLPWAFVKSATSK